MSEYSFKPSVDQVQEFIEIAGDFSNPLDLVRGSPCYKCTTRISLETVNANYANSEV
jgi:hypothetical protein